MILQRKEVGKAFIGLLCLIHTHDGEEKEKVRRRLTPKTGTKMQKSPGQFEHMA